MVSVAKRSRTSAAIFALALLAACTSPPPPPPNPSGKVIMYERPDAKHPAGIRADLSLPRVEANASWYATWLIMLTDGPTETVPFVQVGLIRRPGPNDAPKGFISYRYAGGTIQRREFARLRGDRARASITVSGDKVSLLLGTQALWSGSKSRFFPSAKGIYYQLGDEVSAVGEHLSGDFNNLALRSNDGSWMTINPLCGYRDEGIDIFGSVLVGWHGSGRYVPNRGGGYYFVQLDRPTDAC